VTKRKAWLAWSSGKDSAWALHRVQQSGDVEVTGLLTTVTQAYARVSMHGVREELLDAQAESAGLPLHKVFIPTPCPNEVYEAEMEKILAVAKGEGVERVVFGDVYLEGIRQYREKQLARVGMTGLFPLWEEDSAALAREIIQGGVRAYVTCLDPRTMPRELIGSAFDRAFLEKLPEGVDPCGENGEFHSCVWAGPMFRRPIPVRLGETVERGGFLFRDVLLDGRRRSG